MIHPPVAAPAVPVGVDVAGVDAVAGARLITGARSTLARTCRLPRACAPLSSGAALARARGWHRRSAIAGDRGRPAIIAAPTERAARAEVAAAAPGCAAERCGSAAPEAH